MQALLFLVYQNSKCVMCYYGFLKSVDVTNSRAQEQFEAIVRTLLAQPHLINICGNYESVLGKNISTYNLNNISTEIPTLSSPQCHHNFSAISI